MGSYCVLLWIYMNMIYEIAFLNGIFWEISGTPIFLKTGLDASAASARRMAASAAARKPSTAASRLPGDGPQIYGKVRGKKWEKAWETPIVWWKSPFFRLQTLQTLQTLTMPFSKSFLFPAKPGFKPEASLVHCWRDLRCLHLPATCSGCSADVGKSHMQMRESTSQCTHCRKSLHL